MTKRVLSVVGWVLFPVIIGVFKISMILAGREFENQLASNMNLHMKG
jgi:hypothetical protein